MAEKNPVAEKPGGAESLAAAIIREAEAEGKDFVAQAGEAASRRESEILKEVEAEIEAWLEKEKNALRQAAGHELTNARMQSRRELLGLRREILSRLTAEALESLERDGEFLASFYSRRLAGLQPGRYRLAAAARLEEFLPAKWWREAGVPEGVELDFKGFDEEIEDGARLESTRVTIVISPAMILELDRAEAEKTLSRLVFRGRGEEPGDA